MSTILKCHTAILFFKEKRQEKILPLFYHYAKKATNMRCISLASFRLPFHASVFRMKRILAHFPRAILASEGIVHGAIHLASHHRSLISSHHFSMKASPLADTAARLIRCRSVLESPSFFALSKLALFLKTIPFLNGIHGFLVLGGTFFQSFFLSI